MQQVIPIALAVRPPLISMQAGAGEIGADSDHRDLVVHQKFVAHQAPAVHPSVFFRIETKALP